MNTKIGFIGFGEASQNIIAGLRQERNQEAIKIFSYDILFNDDKNKIIIDRANRYKVTPVYTLEQLSESCDVIINATSASLAFSIAENVANHLNSKHLYVDINATSPKTIKSIAQILNEKKISFVDGAVMGPIPKDKHKVPILISGSGSSRFFKIGKQLNMNLSIIEKEAGSSSGIKMARSIFMKGFTMLLIESLSAAESLDVMNEIILSIGESLDINDMDNILNNYINRTVQHSSRRIAEMKEVLNTFSDENLYMTHGTLNALIHLNESDLNTIFKDGPDDFRKVIKALREVKVDV